MSKFDIHEITGTVKTDLENESALEYFERTAFPHIAANEIVSVLKQNKQLWESVYVKSGMELDAFDYPDKILRLAKGKKENILSLVIAGSSSNIVFIYDLKEYADDFSFTSAFSLPDEKTIYILFFVKE